MRDVWRIGLGAAGVTSAIIAAQEWMARRYYASTLGPREFVDQDARAAWTAVWHELWAPLELATLHASSVYRGHGVAQGAGDPVVLVPGFLLRGRYLWPMQRWLLRLGYRAQIAGIGVNADCIDVMTDRLLRVVAGMSEEANAPVHLVGHSLGGLLARAVATRARELVASVAMLGSPFRGLRMHPVVRGGRSSASRDPCSSGRDGSVAVPDARLRVPVGARAPPAGAGGHATAGRGDATRRSH